MNWKNSVRRNLLAALLVLVSTPAFAAPDTTNDEPKVPATYSPPHCEFAVTFPSAPYTSRRCDDENDSNKCYDLISFTQVYDMESTVNFRVTCNPIDTSVYEYYSAEVMEATLRAMTNRSVVKTFDTSFRTEDGFKQAGLVGEGKSGTLPTIYIAQLWIGRGSAFSVEAEMIGESHEKADILLSEILKSVHYLTDEEKKAKNADAKEEKAEAKEKLEKESGTEEEPKKEEEKKEE
jgi:hypothetical protein